MSSERDLPLARKRVLKISGVYTPGLPMIVSIANEATPELIQLTDLRKEFENRVAVKDLNLTIPEGEIYGLIGPNGAGKTTTIRLACGLLTPTIGNVSVFGINVLAEP
jgi:ABC-type uncharacterized transport system ATPase subunit